VSLTTAPVDIRPRPYPAAMSDDPHELVHDRLRRVRQRYTSGRRDLVQRLLEVGRPVTIAELLELDTEHSQSSLYRNLTVLEGCGVVLRLPSVDNVTRFELSEDLIHHHHHLVCSGCGRLDDVMLPAELEASILGATARLGRDVGYEVHSHRLELVGLCGDCRR
jgi:Fur family transcriptional regulator, ferric uptake regulator